MSESIGYEKDKCYFCGKKEAGYQRAEDNSPSGPFFDACFKCAQKSYPNKER